MQEKNDCPPQISVIVPMGSPSDQMERLRRSVWQHNNISKELIIVAPILDQTYWQGRTVAAEQWIFTDRTGRGSFLYEGGRRATDNILLFLHADTELPADWDTAIAKALQDQRTSGGGFSLRFDRPHFYLHFLIRLSNLFFYLRRELWGDRALFVRRNILQPRLDRIDVPLMEDIRLSAVIRSGGKMVLLRKAVTTSARHFYRRGFLRQTLLILFCRLMYALGTDEQTLFRWYYPQSKVSTSQSKNGRTGTSPIIAWFLTRRK